MGTFTHPLRLFAADGSGEATVEALVDTGATYTWIPREALVELGYESTLKRSLRLADGTIIERDGCEARVALNGETMRTLIIFGDPGSQALLGAVTLETFALAPDPVGRRLVPVTALLMGLRAGFGP